MRWTATIGRRTNTGFSGSVELDHNLGKALRIFVRYIVTDTF